MREPMSDRLGSQQQAPHEGINLSFEELDEINSPRSEETNFDRVVAESVSRRGFLDGLITVGASSFIMGTAGMAGRAHAADRFGFEAVKANSFDTVTVPKGYDWHVVAKWGEPLWSQGADFDQTTRGTARTQALAFGDNNDGMALFVSGGRSVLAVNNEYTNRRIMYGNRKSGKPENKDDAEKGKMAHGISIVEIAENDGKWSIVKDSSFNRRITPETFMEITGPAAGHPAMRTKADPTGSRTLGTWNNCGSGCTPWGTYLTCEENFNGYFLASEKGRGKKPFVLGKTYERYGIRIRDWGYAWGEYDERFDVSRHPNEPHRVGYVVEIDPLDPRSTPKKRTALGRLKHENAELVMNNDGRIVVYLGDDERGEFIYRYVSKDKYAIGGDPERLLDDGKLYAARFNSDGTGRWLELNPKNTGMKSQGEISIFTRMAGSAVKATTMDRPEWIAANPNKAELYCCLTNNNNRGKKPNAGGDATPVGGPNPRAGNRYGQIVRWRPEGGDHTSDKFDWDLYVLAGNPNVHRDERAGSGNVTQDNVFNSPDGLAFDRSGMLWIQTDGNYSNEGDFAGMGNNQMLVGDPQTGELRRFLVGPNQCEVIGFAWSGDRRTLFVGIQHPGERGSHGSHWPDGGQSVPRSAVIAIKRDDGAIIG